MKKTNQIRINNDQLFLIVSALKLFSKEEENIIPAKVYEYYGFTKKEVDELYYKFVKESVMRRNE